MLPLTSSPAWQALLAHRDALATRRISEFWEEDASRGGAFTFYCAGIAADFSKQRITGETVTLLAALARGRGLAEAVERLFSGARVNVTENRPVLHVALRAPRGQTMKAWSDSTRRQWSQCHSARSREPWAITTTGRAWRAPSGSAG